MTSRSRRTSLKSHDASLSPGHTPSTLGLLSLLRSRSFSTPRILFIFVMLMGGPSSQPAATTETPVKRDKTSSTTPAISTPLTSYTPLHQVKSYTNFVIDETLSHPRLNDETSKTSQEEVIILPPTQSVFNNISKTSTFEINSKRYGAADKTDSTVKDGPFQTYDGVQSTLCEVPMACADAIVIGESAVATRRDRTVHAEVWWVGSWTTSPPEVGNHTDHPSSDRYDPVKVTDSSVSDEVMNSVKSSLTPVDQELNKITKTTGCSPEGEPNFDKDQNETVSGRNLPANPNHKEPTFHSESIDSPIDFLNYHKRKVTKDLFQSNRNFLGLFKSGEGKFKHIQRTTRNPPFSIAFEMNKENVSDEITWTGAGIVKQYGDGDDYEDNRLQCRNFVKDAVPDFTMNDARSLKDKTSFFTTPLPLFKLRLPPKSKKSFTKIKPVGTTPVSEVDYLNELGVEPFNESVSLGEDDSHGRPTLRLSILGLFELTTRLGERADGRSELAAARLAVRHINDKKILPGYHLELITNDTKCDPGVGVDAFFHALYTQNSTRMVMLLGSACSDVTESLANVMPYWNIVQVSFGSTSPVLSDRQEFPLFYRTVAPDSSHNPARLAFVRGFSWDTVTALSQDQDVYTMAVNDLVTELERANITCPATITFAETDFKDQLRMLKDLDTRIIIGSFSHEVAPKIFCEAFQLGMFGSDYAWILQGGPSDIWWQNSTECSQSHLSAAVEGLLLVSSHNSIAGESPSFSGLTNSKFQEELEVLGLPTTRFAPQTYDAVWAIALSLREAQVKWRRAFPRGPTLGHFDYGRRDMAEEFLMHLGQLNFLGVSGPVSFSGADRVGISAFYQVQGGDVCKVALFHPSTGHLDFFCPDCLPLIWQGGQVPIAKRVFKLRVVTIDPAAFLSITCVASVGITLAIAFLVFNLHFRKLKYIKLSSPRLNNMVVVGCILVYTAVILLGLDHATLPASKHFPAVCTARVYLLSAGFSLAFGSMFTKTYRVHRIFTRSRSGIVKNKLLQDTQLISLICVLLLIDGLIVTLWVIVDPIQRHLRNLTIEISSSDRSVVYQPQVEVCRSQYTHGWLGALYVYKGLLLLVGVYMAWETRHVKIQALNDSQYIGISVYSVVITSGIVVVLANLISERATLAFVTTTTLILTSTTATLCLLFLPKLHAILSHTDNGDPIMHSMGLKIECNTRRFVTDDRRELYYRVEVQNRVYRRELVTLDQEIGKLTKQMFGSPPGSSHSSSSLGVNKKGDIASMGDSKRNIVGSGLPMLLLSVLPPVIPRASWPSADHSNSTIRRQVTFSSEPKLDESSSVSKQPDGARYYSRDDDAAMSSKLGVLGRLLNFLGSSRPSSRKTSTASFSGEGGGGIASALKTHMGYLAGLVPSTSSNPGSATPSCHTSTTAINIIQPVPASARELHPLARRYCGRPLIGSEGGGSGPIISVTSNYDGNSESDISRRKFSLAMCLSRKDEGMDDECMSERRVSYSGSRKIHHQHSQPILSFKERVRGSPRFPHKIVPTCSLNALEDRRRSSSSAFSYCANPSGSNYLSRRQSSQHHLHVSSITYELGNKCRSLEDANVADPEVRGSRGAVNNWKPRAASYSPNCDVWGTAEFGIPLSELASSSRCKERGVASGSQRTDS